MLTNEQVKAIETKVLNTEAWLQSRGIGNAAGYGDMQSLLADRHELVAERDEALGLLRKASKIRDSWVEANKKLEDALRELADAAKDFVSYNSQAGPTITVRLTDAIAAARKVLT